ncbi:MAG: hypothetical protein LBV52_05705 [Spirochaetaceae bacterium]|jgi:hypothetical protein|nr:hypothetical protein [Spirochaetaceae bacterium]
MKEYEVVKKIINPVALDTRPVVSVDEIEIDDIDKYVLQFASGKNSGMEREVQADGSITFKIINGDITQIITFTEL